MNKTSTYRTFMAIVMTVAISVGASATEKAVGNWEGNITFNEKSKAEIKVNLTRSGTDELTGTIILPGQKNESLVLQNINANGVKISFDLIDGRTTASFNGTLTPDGDILKGDFTQAGCLFPFELSRCHGKLSAEPAKEVNTNRN